MNRKLSGSLTVEASLVFPIVFFAVISLIYIGIYLHDVTCLKVIVDEAAQRYELAYSNKIDIDTGMVLSDDERISRGLYWRFTSNSNLDNKVKDYIMERVQENLILKDDNILIDTKINNYIVKKIININVKKEFSTVINPVNRLLSSNGNGLTMAVSAKSVIKDQAELIRNVDMLDDLSDYIPALRNAKEQYENKVMDIVNFFKDL